MFQSGFRTHHYSETALLQVVKNINTNLNGNKLSVLVLLFYLISYIYKKCFVSVDNHSSEPVLFLLHFLFVHATTNQQEVKGTSVNRKHLFAQL